MTFGTRFKEAFNDAPVAEIARKMGKSYQAIKNYIDGRVPAWDILVEISNSTGCSIHWLLTGDGDKFVSKNTPSLKNKLVAEKILHQDTVPVGDTSLITQLSTAQFAIVPVPLIGTISASRQTIVLSKEPVAVKVPSILTRSDTALFQIEGNELSAEGLHDGDLLIVHKPDEPLDGKLVIAEVDHRTIIRIYKSSGAMVSLSPIEGDLPLIRFPKNSISIKYIVSSITRPFE